MRPMAGTPSGPRCSPASCRGRLRQLVDDFRVLPRGDFGHDLAKLAVHVNLRRHKVGQDGSSVRHHRDACLSQEDSIPPRSLEQLRYMDQFDPVRAQFRQQVVEHRNGGAPEMTTPMAGAVLRCPVRQQFKLAADIVGSILVSPETHHAPRCAPSAAAAACPADFAVVMLSTKYNLWSRATSMNHRVRSAS